jgi:predicted aspartyl protease
MRASNSAVLCAIAGAAFLAACQSAMVPAAVLPAVTTVPFELVRNEIIIDASIGDSTPQRFMLDCGVDPSVIDLTLARSLGIDIDETQVGEATGAGDEEGLTVMLSSIPGLAIQDMTFDPIVALAADISPFSAALGFPLAGILGHSFLEHRVVRIDYPARQITIGADAGAFGLPATAVTQRYVVPLRFNSDEELIPVFDLVIEGRAVSVTLDTGSSGGLELFPSAVTRLGLEDEKAAGEATEALGARGRRKLTKGSLSNVGLGPFIIAELPTHFGEHSISAEAREGNAGNQLFQGFVLTLDYVNGEVTFEQ